MVLAPASYTQRFYQMFHLERNREQISTDFVPKTKREWMFEVTLWNDDVENNRSEKRSLHKFFSSSVKQTIYPLTKINPFPNQFCSSPVNSFTPYDSTPRNSSAIVSFSFLSFHKRGFSLSRGERKFYPLDKSWSNASRVEGIWNYYNEPTPAILLPPPTCAQ